MSKVMIRYLRYFGKISQLIREKYYKFVLGCPRNVKFLGSIKFFDPEKIKISENVRFNDGIFLNIGKMLIIKENVTISANVLITDTASDIKKLPIHVHTRSPVIINKNVWIGAGAIILPGVEIGEGCVISAGAILSQSTGKNEVWIGNPARKAAILK